MSVPKVERQDWIILVFVFGFFGFFVLDVIGGKSAFDQCFLHGYSDSKSIFWHIRYCGKLEGNDPMDYVKVWTPWDKAKLQPIDKFAEASMLLHERRKHRPERYEE